jgi:hypothetical protein
MCTRTFHPRAHRSCFSVSVHTTEYGRSLPTGSERGALRPSQCKPSPVGDVPLRLPLRPRSSVHTAARKLCWRRAETRPCHCSKHSPCPNAIQDACPSTYTASGGAADRPPPEPVSARTPATHAAFTGRAAPSPARAPKDVALKRRHTGSGGCGTHLESPDFGQRLGCLAVAVAVAGAVALADFLARFCR